MPTHHIRAIHLFNAEHYREALLAFEERWHAERSDFLRGLINLANAMNQLRLGLVAGPRRNLTVARALLSAYEPQHEGLDIVRIRAYIAELQALISDESPLDTPHGVPWAQVPRLHLSIPPSPAPDQ
ncbi:MAG: DUF309 domain-containing protein [Chloroflexaceae bacterium]|nr:DUF309 domain-containing protein [Chloroflexaceae bacterium]